MWHGQDTKVEITIWSKYSEDIVIRGNYVENLNVYMYLYTEILYRELNFIDFFQEKIQNFSCFRKFVLYYRFDSRTSRH